MRIALMLPACLALASCANTPENQAKWQAFSDGLVAGAAAYSAGYNSARQPVAQDWDWDWDQFYYNGALVWVCRGVQTAQFAHTDRCAYRAQTDWRWPQK